jgi:hypothetical protein
VYTPHYTPTYEKGSSMKTVGLVITGVAALLAAVALLVWLFMLLLGIIHTEIPAIPPLSFWVSGASLLALGIVGGTLTSPHTAQSK